MVFSDSVRTKVQEEASHGLSALLEETFDALPDGADTRGSRRQAEQTLQDALAFAESIVDTMRDPLLVLDGDLRVVSASREFYRTFGVTPGETESLTDPSGIMSP